MSAMNLRNQTALITGASSGIGVEFARQFAARGANLALTARRADRLETLAQELRSQYGITADVIVADLARPGAAHHLVHELANRELAIHTLVNNAGFGMHGAFVNAELGRLADMLTVNIVALTELTRLLLPQLMAHGTGALVNIASTASFQPLPEVAAYAATKSYVRSLSEAIWWEARGSSIKVLAVSPGPTETEFFDNLGGTFSAVTKKVPAKHVVKTSLRRLDRANTGPSVVVGTMNKVLSQFSRFVPTRMLVNTTARPTKAEQR